MQYEHKQLSHLGSSVLLLPGVLGALELAATLYPASRTDLRGPRPRSLSGESERADSGDSVPASEPGVGVSCCWPGLKISCPVISGIEVTMVAWVCGTCAASGGWCGRGSW